MHICREINVSSDFVVLNFFVSIDLNKYKLKEHIMQ
jgi:hypothetical protein